MTARQYRYGRQQCSCSVGGMEQAGQAGLACAAQSHATWQSVNDSRYAVHASFIWLSKTYQMALQGVKSFLPPDPRLDHDLLQAHVPCNTLGPAMPPLRALGVSMRLRMHR